MLAPQSLRNITMDGLVFREIADFTESLEIAFAYRADPGSPLSRPVLRALDLLARSTLL